MQPAEPTPDVELNDVLAEMTRQTLEALGPSLLAIYLQGSFGMGGWDIYSDVDFMSVVKDDINPDQLEKLQAMHARLFHLPSQWAQHLEGSYFPRDLLRQADPLHRTLYYLDNTASILMRSSHDNTRVVRWVTREHGIALYGPPPRQLIDEISTDDLRCEVLDTMREWAGEIFTGQYDPTNRWSQPFIVISYCRMLQSLHTGTIESKPAGVRWGLANLDPAWADLIGRAWQDRPDPSYKVRQSADPQDVQRTLALVCYALAAAPCLPNR